MTQRLSLTLLISFLLLATPKAFAQNTFGLEFGHNFENYSGRTYEFDSIMVLPDVGFDPGEAFGGIFFNYNLSRRFQLHNKLNYGQRFFKYNVFNNQKECTFCPEKLKLLSIKSLGLEIYPEFSLVQSKKVKLNVFGGVSTTINFSKSNEDVFFEDEPGVTEVFNALNSVVEPVTLGLGYGTSLEISRIIFWAKVTTPVQFTNTIILYNENYDFQNSWGFLSFSLGYKFYSFRLKKKDGESR